MMNRAEIAKPSDIEARLPIFTDQEVQRILRTQIDIVERSVQQTIRTRETNPYNSLLLFSFTGEEFSHLKDKDNEITGRVESDRLQQLGLEVMREYGLDENISRPEYHNRGRTKDGIINDKDGYPQEIKLYPSQTIDGLVFERTKKFITATGQTLSIDWKVEDKTPISI